MDTNLKAVVVVIEVVSLFFCLKRIKFVVLK